MSDHTNVITVTSPLPRGVPWSRTPSRFMVSPMTMHTKREGIRFMSAKSVVTLLRILKDITCISRWNILTHLLSLSFMTRDTSSFQTQTFLSRKLFRWKLVLRSPFFEWIELNCVTCLTHSFWWCTLHTWYTIPFSPVHFNLNLDKTHYWFKFSAINLKPLSLHSINLITFFVFHCKNKTILYKNLVSSFSLESCQT